MTLPVDGNAPLNSPSHYDEHVRVANLATHPNFYVTRDTTTTALHGVDTAIPWVGEVRDTHGVFDVGAPTRFTIPSGWDGLWLFTVSFSMGTSTSGRRGIRFRVNGSASLAFGNDYRLATSGTTVVATAALIPLAAADYIEVVVYQDSTTTLTIGGTGNACTGSYMGA